MKQQAHREAQRSALHCEYPANTDNESNMLVAF
jgi:hypothetical protein